MLGVDVGVRHGPDNPLAGRAKEPLRRVGVDGADCPVHLLP